MKREPIISKIATNQITNIRELSNMLENILISIENNNDYTSILIENKIYKYLLNYIMQDHLIQDYNALFNTIKVLTTLCDDETVC